MGIYDLHALSRRDGKSIRNEKTMSTGILGEHW